MHACTTARVDKNHLRNSARLHTLFVFCCIFTPQSVAMVTAPLTCSTPQTSTLHTCLTQAATHGHKMAARTTAAKTVALLLLLAARGSSSQPFSFGGQSYSLLKGGVDEGASNNWPKDKGVIEERKGAHYYAFGPLGKGKRAGDRGAYRMVKATLTLPKMQSLEAAVRTFRGRVPCVAFSIRVEPPSGDAHSLDIGVEHDSGYSRSVVKGYEKEQGRGHTNPSACEQDRGWFAFAYSGYLCGSYPPEECPEKVQTSFHGIPARADADSVDVTVKIFPEEEKLQGEFVFKSAGKQLGRVVTPKIYLPGFFNGPWRWGRFMSLLPDVDPTKKGTWPKGSDPLDGSTLPTASIHNMQLCQTHDSSSCTPWDAGKTEHAWSVYGGQPAGKIDVQLNTRGGASDVAAIQHGPAHYLGNACLGQQLHGGYVQGGGDAPKVQFPRSAEDCVLYLEGATFSGLKCAQGLVSTGAGSGGSGTVSVVCREGKWRYNDGRCVQPSSSYSVPQSNGVSRNNVGMPSSNSQDQINQMIQGIQSQVTQRIRSQVVQGAVAGQRGGMGDLGSSGGSGVTSDMINSILNDVSTAISSEDNSELAGFFASSQNGPRQQITCADLAGLYAYQAAVPIGNCEGDPSQWKHFSKMEIRHDCTIVLTAEPGKGNLPRDAKRLTITSKLDARALRIPLQGDVIRLIVGGRDGLYASDAMEKKNGVATCWEVHPLIKVASGNQGPKASGVCIQQGQACVPVWSVWVLFY